MLIYLFLYIPKLCHNCCYKATGGAPRGSAAHVNLPVLGGLDPHVPAVLRVEAGEEQVGVFLRGRRAGVFVPAGARAARVRLQRGAETHPHRVGGPIGAGDSGAGRRREAAGSDQDQLVSSALPPHRLGGVEMATEETV